MSAAPEVVDDPDRARELAAKVRAEGFDDLADWIEREADWMEKEGR